MPEVDVEINGRKYRMACEEGQEEHLLDLAARFDSHVEGFKSGFGEIGDSRLMVMAGISVLDELDEARRRVGELEQEVDELTQAGAAVTAEAEELERKLTAKLTEAARKVEAIATAIDETGSAGQGGGAN
jgi:cell division protein ZapA